MKVCGIIAEFNPFHNGHAHIIQKARELTGADYVVIAMSGNYVQRGEPALVPMSVRTETALRAGADLCFELPLIVSTGSAEYFARGSVALFNSLGVVDDLVFGSESGHPEDADSSVLLPPNDILGKEYLAALKYLHSPIIPHAIPRIGTDYHDTQNTDHNICSASYLREHILSAMQDWENLMPDVAVPIFKKALAEQKPMTLDYFSEYLYYKLWNEKPAGYDSYFDVYTDLSNKILEHLEHFTDFSAFIKELKSKEIAYSHISRSLLHIMLNITKHHEELLREVDYCPYLRPLGFRKEATPLLAAIKENCSAPYLDKLSEAPAILSKNSYELFHNTMEASNLYLYTACRPGQMPRNEYRQSLTIL